MDFNLEDLLNEDSNIPEYKHNPNLVKVEATSRVAPVVKIPTTPTTFVSVPTKVEAEVTAIWENPTKQSYKTKSGEVRNEPVKEPSINSPENIILGLNATLLKKNPIPMDSHIRIYLRESDKVSGKLPMKTRKGAIDKNSLVPIADPSYARTPEAKRSTKSNSSQGGNLYTVNEKPANVECPSLERVSTKEKDKRKLFAPIELIFCSHGMYQKAFHYSEQARKLFLAGDNEDFEYWFTSKMRKGENRGECFFRIFPQMCNPELSYLYIDAIESIWVGTNCVWKFKPIKQDEHQIQVQQNISQRSNNVVKNSLVQNLSTVITNCRSHAFMLQKVPNKVFRYYLKDSSVVILESFNTSSKVNFEGKHTIPVSVTNTSEDDWCTEGMIGKIQISVKPRKLPRFIKYMNHSSLYLHILHAINKYEKSGESVNQDYFLKFRSPEYSKLDRIGCITAAVESEGKWHIRVKDEANELVFIRGVESEVKDDLHKSISQYGILNKLDLKTLEDTDKWYLLDVWNHLSTWFSKLPNYYFHDNCATAESVKKYNSSAASVRKSCRNLLTKHIESGIITDRFGKKLTETNIQLLVDMLDANWFRFSEDNFWVGKIKTCINHNPEYRLEPKLFFMPNLWHDKEQWCKLSSKLIYMLTGFELNFVHNRIAYNHIGYSPLTKWVNACYSNFPAELLPKKGMLLSKLVEQIQELSNRGYTRAINLAPSKWDVAFNDKLLNCKIEQFS
jgi:hypothetical protein